MPEAGRPDPVEPPGDEQRFEELFRSTYPRIVAYCRRRVPPAEAEDVVASTFLVAWRRLDDVLAADNPLAWLYAVAYRTVGNQYRSRNRIAALRRRLAGQPPPATASPDTAIEAHDDVDRALAALERLPAHDRELIRLAAFEQLSYEKIGQVIGKSPGAVRSRLFRARARLRKIYHQLAEVNGPDRELGS